MCNRCCAAGVLSDDQYECHNCGHIGRTDQGNPGHCVECGHDMRDPVDRARSSMDNG